MTRNRVPYRGMGIVAAAVAAALSPNVFSQATATLQGAAAGASSCAYSSIQTLSNGTVVVTCNVAAPGAPGTVGFSAVSYPDVGKDAAAASVNFSVAVQRIGGSTGAVNGTVASSTPAICTVPTGAVSFAEGDLLPKNVSVTGLALGTCNLTFALGAGSAGTPGTLATSIIVKDAASAPPAPAGCEGKTPTANFQQLTSFGPAGQGTAFSGSPGTTYSWPLPKGPNGVQVSSALITHTQHTSATSPLEMSIEWSISKCPGDIAYYKTTEAAYIPARGPSSFPCGGTFGIESGGLKFGTTLRADYCKVPNTGETWYINLRYISGTSQCPAGKCNVMYSWF